MENEGIRDIRSYARYPAYRGIALPPERETRLKLASVLRLEKDVTNLYWEHIRAFRTTFLFFFPSNLRSIILTQVCIDSN